MLLDFCYFREFQTRKEWTYCLIFEYFHEFDTRKEWTRFSILALFMDFRPERNELIARFLPIVTNLRWEIVARKLVAADR